VVALPLDKTSLGKLAIWRAAASVPARSPVTLREACEARSATTPLRRRNLQEHQQRLPSPASVPTVWRFRAGNASSRQARRQTVDGGRQSTGCGKACARDVTGRCGLVEGTRW